MQTVGNAASAAAAVNALLKKLKARYSLKPPLVLQTDNGPEFKIQFERALASRRAGSGWKPAAQTFPGLRAEVRLLREVAGRSQPLASHPPQLVAPHGSSGARDDEQMDGGQ